MLTKPGAHMSNQHKKNSDEETSKILKMVSSVILKKDAGYYNAKIQTDLCNLARNSLIVQANALLKAEGNLLEKVSEITELLAEINNSSFDDKNRDRLMERCAQIELENTETLDAPDTIIDLVLKFQPQIDSYFNLEQDKIFDPINLSIYSIPDLLSNLKNEICELNNSLKVIEKQINLSKTTDVCNSLNIILNEINTAKNIGKANHEINAYLTTLTQKFNNLSASEKHDFKRFKATVKKLMDKSQVLRKKLDANLAQLHKICNDPS